MRSQNIDSANAPLETSFLALSPSISMKEAIMMMSQVRASCALIIENQKLLGIFTERDVVRITTSKTRLETLTLAELMTKEVITIKISETQDIFALSRLFSRNKIRHLPVLDEENQVVGLVTPSSIRNRLKPEYLLRYIRVNEVMNSQVIQASPSDSILIVAQQMARHRVSCVVIVDSQTSFPVGIVTERDIVLFHQQNLDFAQVMVESVMSSPLSTMCPEESLWSVHQQMQELNVRRLVITRPSGELAGIVTQTQMLKMLDPIEMYHVLEQMQEIIDRQTNELQQLNHTLQIANAELELLSKVDELTQILNRRQFNDFFALQWKHLSSLGKPLSLIMCDVDHFKSYNDTYGHLTGDQCLIKIAQALRESTRKGSDLVARYGGEEFAVVLPNTNSDGAERVAQKILAQVEKLQIPHISSSTKGYITISLGVATIIPDQDSSPEILLQFADELLYQSKQKGRNRYSLKVMTTNPLATS